MRDLAMTGVSGNSEPERTVPPADAPASGAATIAPPAPDVKPAPSRPKLDELPPWRVLLHNDDVNDQLYVVETLVELTTIGKRRAVEVMLEAHHRGLALVTVTHQERAELYRDQFASKRLKATIEPAV